MYTLLTIGGISNGHHGRPVRAGKGNSLLQVVNDYTVIDLETTGLDPEYESIIEMAALRVRGNTVVDSLSSLINPGYEIDEFITDLTGITNEMLAPAPAIEEYLPVFLDFIGDSILVGHNVNFDINFIYDNADRLLGHGISNDFIDTMRLGRKLLPELPHHRLHDLMSHFSIDSDAEHRALSDVLSTNAVYQKLYPIFEDQKERFHFYSGGHSGVRAKDISTENTTFDADSPVFGKVFVFTGTLERMVRKDAMQAVVDLGGSCGDNVTKRTNYLVLGNYDYVSSIKGGKSNKHRKAESLKLAGQDIDIISENVFYDMLGITTEEVSHV